MKIGVLGGEIAENSVEIIQRTTRTGVERERGHIVGGFACL